MRCLTTLCLGVAIVSGSEVSVAGFSLSSISLVTSLPKNWNCGLPSSSSVQASSDTWIHALFSWQGYTSGTLEVRAGSSQGTLQSVYKLSSLTSSGCYEVSLSSIYFWTKLQSNSDVLKVAIYLNSVLQGTAKIAIKAPPFISSVSLLPGNNADCNQAAQNAINSTSVLTVRELAEGFVTICLFFHGYEPGAPVLLEMVNRESGYAENIMSVSPSTRFNGFYHQSREIGQLMGIVGVGPSLFRIRYRNRVYAEQNTIISTQCTKNCLRPPSNVFQLPYAAGDSWAVGASPHGRADMFAASNETLALSPSTQQLVQASPSNMHYTAIDLTRLGGTTLSPLQWTVTAAAAGKVIAVSPCRVEIDHGYGWKTMYYHISNPIVKVGDEVRAGQAISNVAATKSAALCEGGSWTLAHVHFQLTWFGIGAIDGATLSGYDVQAGRYSYDPNCDFTYLSNHTRVCQKGVLTDSDKICPRRFIPPSSSKTGLDLAQTRAALSGNGPLKISMPNSVTMAKTPQRYLNLTGSICESFQRATSSKSGTSAKISGRVKHNKLKKVATASSRPATAIPGGNAYKHG